MKKFLLLCSLTLSTFLLFSQNKVLTGKIIDSRSKEPMVGATVLVKGTQVGTATDANGNFKLTVPADAKTLRVSYVGYVVKDMPIGATTNFNITIESSDIAGNEVVVTSSRVAESIKEAPVQIEKMTAREIRSAASGDFYQSIGNFKGVDIVTTSFGFKVINLRGFGDTRSLRTKQFIDGVDKEAPGLNFPIGNMVGANDLDLENIEIVSGAASSLYGANAMQGVISMNSKSPYDFKGFAVQLKGGGTTVPGPYMDLQLRYANTFGKKNKLAFKFTGEFSQLSDWPATDDSLNRYGNISANVNLNSALQQNAVKPYCPTCPVTTEDHNKYVALTSWLAFNPAASNFDPTVPKGFVGVQAPGYMEKELADYNAKNIKFSTGLYYRFTDNLELSGTYKFGYGTAVYQATARYQIKDFFFNQPRLELKGKNFFIRAYASIEDAGQSYNLGLTGAYESRAAVPDYVTRFSTAYFNTIDTLVGGIANCQTCFDGTQNQWVLDSARNVARRVAAGAWYRSGTQQFTDTFSKIIKDKNSLTGTEFYDKSALVHVEGQYNWDFVKWLDIITGASYRIYLPNSRGTILADTGNVKIRVQEVGAYLMATKKLFNDQFKIIGSLRVDKNSNFNAQVSPRGSLVYTYKAKNSSHTFRVSAASAFRTPTLQDQYLYLDIGLIKLVGNLNGMNNLYTQQSVNDYSAYYTAHPNDLTGATNLLQAIQLAPIKPEQVTSIEFGYRTDIRNKVFIDFSAYYSIYKKFIGFTRVINPNKDTVINGQTVMTTNGMAGTESGVNNIIMGNQTLLPTWVNAAGKVPSWGAAVSVSYYVGHGITPYVNYTYADLDDKNLSNSGAIILSGFNTPKHKFNIGIAGNKVWKGLGFSANFKWVTSYQWESPFADGTVPSFNTLDVQLFYEIEKANSTIRLGASNVYNNKHIEAVGSPKIGAIYYVGWLFDLPNFGKKAAPAEIK
ncbi:MAG: TonB-dependent receptor [Bacteroidota bacterium]|nr:TonB-dependent receptor [Bacteroidota bacterium]